MPEAPATSAAATDAPLDREIQIGGPDVTTYGAAPVDPGVARPLIEGLSIETVVEEPSGTALLPGIHRTPLAIALRAAAAHRELNRS